MFQMFYVDNFWGLSVFIMGDSTVYSTPFTLKFLRGQIYGTFCTTGTRLINKDFFENFSEHRKNIWNIKDLQKNIIKTSTYKTP